MSYDVDEGVLDAEEHLVFLKLLKETYPDARRNGRRWESASLSLADCDGIALRTDDKPQEYPLVYAKFYRTIGSGRVYRPWGEALLNVFFQDLKTKDPSFYEQLSSKLKAGVVRF